MNNNAVSAECFHRMHSVCDYEDCACNCHLRDELDEYDPNAPVDDPEDIRMTIEHLNR